MQIDAATHAMRGRDPCQASRRAFGVL